MRPLSVTVLALLVACASAGGAADPHGAGGTAGSSAAGGGGRGDAGSGGGEAGGGGQATPRFVSTLYLDLAPIAGISRFRSGIGHDYHDDVESCRSMKHYFRPADDVDWGAIEIRSPVAGNIVRRIDEWAGAQLWIRAASRPEIELRIFHISLARELGEGDTVAEGEVLGRHVGSQTMSDIAVAVYGRSGMHLVSYFDVLTDEAFAKLQARGVSSRDALIISRAERDADPLECQGDVTITEGTLPNWVELSPEEGTP